MKRFSNLRSIVLAVMFAAIAAVLIANGSQASINGNGMTVSVDSAPAACGI